MHGLFLQIAVKNPHKVNLASQHKGSNKRQATSTDYSSIRIHPIFTNVDPSARSQVEATDSPLFNSIRALSSVLMVKPVQGNFILPPRCTEYIIGPNRGKCAAPLNIVRQRCGEFGIVPEEYTGTREVCESFNQTLCHDDGPDGPGIPDTDYLLFVSVSTTGELYEIYIHVYMHRYVPSIIMQF